MENTKTFEEKEIKENVPRKVTLNPEARKWIIGIVVVVAVAGFLMMMGSSITGAATIDTEATASTIADSVEKKLDSLGINANVSSEIEACTNRNTELMNSIRETSDNLISCTSDKNTLQAKINVLEEEKKTSISTEVLRASQDEIEDKEDEIEKLEDELDEIKDKYEPIITNIAKKLCCVVKNFDNSINSYTVSDTNIHCVNDGDVSLSC